MSDTKKVELLADAYITPSTKAGDVLDLESGMADRLVEMKVAKPHVPRKEPEIPDGDPSDAWKVDQLKAYADLHEVDLAGASTKADILAAIETAANPEPPAE